MGVATRLCLPPAVGRRRIADRSRGSFAVFAAFAVDRFSS